jgi:hypothetical protein
MNDAPAAADRRRRRPRPPRSHPTDQDLEGLLAPLAKPAADLLAALSTAAITMLRALLADAYERGRRDAAAERATGGPVGNGQITVRVADPPAGPSPAAVAAAVMRQAAMGVRR